MCASKWRGASDGLRELSSTASRPSGLHGLCCEAMTTTQVGDAFARPPSMPAAGRGARIASFLTTGLICAMMTLSGILYLAGAAPVVAGIHQLGYPDYFRQMLGVAKLLGVAGLLLPGRPALREWAYAGFVFDLVAATISHLATGTEAAAVPAAATLVILLVSRHLRQTESRIPLRAQEGR
jgi:hypothetical protein